MINTLGSASGKLNRQRPAVPVELECQKINHSILCTVEVQECPLKAALPEVRDYNIPQAEIDFRARRYLSRIPECFRECQSGGLRGLRYGDYGDTLLNTQFNDFPSSWEFK